MSNENDEEIGGVIYSALLDISEPTYVSELCDKVRGLRKRQEKVAALLRMMCDNDIVVNVGGRYILKERHTPKLERESDHDLSYDGPVHDVTGTDSHRHDRNAFDIESRPPPVHRTTGEITVPQASRAVVPVQQSVVRRTSSSDSTCDPAEQQVNADKLRKIIEFLGQAPGPVKAKDIAQRTSLGQSRSDVNRYLYFLEKQNIVENIGRAEWKFVKEVKDVDLQVYAAQLAKTPGAKSKGKQSAGSANDACHCPNAGSGCVHVTNNFQQNIHHHHYNVQVGEHNRMDSGPPSAGSPPGENGH